ncbi:hypothetical protein SNEBB_008532 [Seison nebaliae]|nr:hypothetical protein SNEBB_008532 [Seison nebaliae]
MSLNFNVIESTPDYMNNESSSSTFTATPNQLSMSPIFDVNDEFRCLTRSSNKCGTSIQSSLTTNGKIHLNSNSNILKSGYVEQQNNNHSVFNFDMSITNSKSSIESKISDLYLTSLTDKSDLSNDSHTTKNHHIIGAYDQSPDSEPEFKLADLNDDTSLIEVCSQNKFPGCLESDQPFRLAHRQTQMSCESFTVCSPPANQVTIESTNQMNRVGDEVSLKEFETNHSFNSVTEFYGSPQTCVLPSSFPSSSGDSEFIKDKNLSNSKECQAILSLKRDMDQLSDSSDNESISGKTGAVYVLEVCGTLPVLCDLLRDRRIHFTADRCHDNVRRVIATPQFKTISTQTSD